ncbi:Pr6Pr family membrane protein [Chryseobacterium sp.]|uniref:Pr6Pr family membrane protein n=1 Tax=Chryseobacterium sp. TaxID=1871047 RepID=UPI0025BC75F8|nr:Pr6Pr family membrane protein [Chryseobacterium sp.]
MKKILAFIICSIGWFAIIVQYYLMIENTLLPFSETTVRFFSFFTILTNIIVAVYFTKQLFTSFSGSSNSNFLTAITVYILIVGIIYQVILRSSWNPTGLQRFVDELLHGVIPFLTLVYWYLYGKKSGLKYGNMIKWAIYPLIYLFYILIRGGFSGFYPYPFVNVSEIGIAQTLVNSFYVLIFFIIVSGLLISIGRFIGIKR